MKVSKDKKTILLVGLMIIFSSFLFILKFSSPDASIGGFDEANLANLAKNIARGKGPLLDSAWLHTNGGLGDGNLPAPEPYFGLYPAFIVAPFFKIFGETRLSLIMPALILQGSIVIISSIIVFKIYNNRIQPTILIASTLLVSKQLIYSINGMSDIYMATFTIFSIFFLSKGVKNNNKKMISSSGFLSGLSIGMKISGIFSTFSIIGLLLLGLKKHISPKKLINYILIFFSAWLLAATPFFTYNLHYFNSIFPAGFEKVGEARLVRQNIACNNLSIEGENFKSDCNSYTHDAIHKYSTFNPKSKFVGNRQKAYLNLLGSNFKEFLNEFQENKIVPLYLFPISLAGIFIAFQRIFFSKMALNSLSYETLFINFSSPVILIGGILTGILTQSQERYWFFTYPLLLVTSYYFLKKTFKNNLFFNKLILLITIVFSPHGYILNSYPNKTILYDTVKNIIPEDAVVLNSNPSTFAFHTDRKSVALPFTSNTEIVKDVAKKYSANYLAIINGDVHNKNLKETLITKKVYFLEKKYSTPELIIFSIKHN